jgi:hypothetical protein
VVVAGSLAHNRGRGGHTWIFLQYLLGFRRLGWDVLFVDRIDPSMSTDRRGRECPPEESEAFRYLAGVMEGFGLEDRYAVLCDDGSTVLGLSRGEVVRRTRSASFLLNVMGYLTDEEILGAATCRVFLDTDPGFDQFWRALGLADPFAGHDAFVTTGENIGRPGCRIPDCGLPWITTPPPVVRPHWEPEGPDTERPGSAFTSVARWRGPFDSLEYAGASYGLRAEEFRRLMPLPVLSGGRFELALEIQPSDNGDRALLAGNGWTVLDPEVVAGNPWRYRTFIQRSAAEFSVAKNLYVDTHSGRVSDRSLCYLASGRPVLAQDTGFSARYPTGTGLVAFRTLEEAWAGVEEIRGNYDRHARTARELTAEYFESDRVLGRLVESLAHA